MHASGGSYSICDCINDPECRCQKYSEHQQWLDCYAVYVRFKACMHQADHIQFVIASFSVHWCNDPECRCQKYVEQKCSLGSIPARAVACVTTPLGRSLSLKIIAYVFDKAHSFSPSGILLGLISTLEHSYERYAGGTLAFIIPCLPFYVEGGYGKS